MALPTITIQTDSYFTTTNLNAETIANTYSTTTTTTTTTSPISTSTTTTTTTTTNTKDSGHERRNATGLPRMVAPGQKLFNLASMQDDAPASPRVTPHPVIPKSPRLLKEKPTQVNFQTSQNASEKESTKEKNNEILSVESESVAPSLLKSLEDTEPVFIVRRLSVVVPKKYEKKIESNNLNKQTGSEISPRHLLSSQSNDMHSKANTSNNRVSTSASQTSHMDEPAKKLANQMVDEFVTNTEKKSVKSGLLLQNYFYPLIKNTNAWGKFNNSRNLVLQTNIPDHVVNQYSDNAKKQMLEMMRPFAQDSVSFILGDKLDTSSLPKELISFLFHADLLLLEQYLDRSKVNVKDINAARVGLFKDLLVKNILIPLLLASDSESQITIAEKWFQAEQFQSLVDSFAHISSYFLIKSYEDMPSTLKIRLDKLAQNEIMQEEDEKKIKNAKLVKSRISNFQSKKSSRNLVMSDEKKSSSNPLEDKARDKYLLKKNNKLIVQLLNEFGFEKLDKKFQDSLNNEIKTSAESAHKLQKITILKIISDHTKMYLYAEEYSDSGIDSGISKFAEVISDALEKNMAIQTKHRATMHVAPINLDELDKLMEINLFANEKTLSKQNAEMEMKMNFSAEPPRSNNLGDASGNQTPVKLESDVAKAEKDNEKF